MAARAETYRSVGRPAVAAGFGDEPPSIGVGDFYRIAMSRLRLLIPCMALTFGLALAYILLSSTTYTATMSILVDPRERVPVGVDAAPMPQNPDAALVESQMRVMTSRPVLRKVVDDQHLIELPTGVVGQIIATLSSALSGAPPSPEARREAAADRLEKSIALKRSERNYVIDVEVKGPTRAKAVAIAQALADAYMAAKSNFTDQVADKEKIFLDRRIVDLRARVDAAERKAQDYRDAHALVVSDGHSSPEQRLKDANTALVTAHGRRADVEARYQQIKAALSAGVDASSVNDNLRSTVIEKLRSDYASLARDEAYAQSVLGPRHPSYLTIQKQLESVRAQIRAEQQRIAQATERELKSAREAESTATKLVTTLEATTNKVGDERVGLNELDRAAASLRTAYEKMLAARESVRRDAIASPLAVLISPPVAPTARSSPKTVPALLVAFVAGLNLWILVALAAEYRERRDYAPPAPRGVYRRPMRAASLGAAAVDAKTFNAKSFNAKDWAPDDTGHVVLPDIARLARAGPTPRRAGLAAVSAVIRASNPYSDAVEDLLDHVLDALGDVGHTPFIGVAGVAPGCGATTVALALAHAACNRGQRVLVVDRCDRAPRLTAFAEKFESAILHRSGLGAHILRRDGDGEVLALSVEGAARAGDGVAWDDDAFDLVLVDSGLMRAAARAIQAAGVVDGLIAVDRRVAGPARAEIETELLGLDDMRMALVLTSAPGGAAR